MTEMALRGKLGKAHDWFYEGPDGLANYSRLCDGNRLAYGARLVPLADVAAEDRCQHCFPDPYRWGSNRNCEDCGRFYRDRRAPHDSGHPESPDPDVCPACWEKRKAKYAPALTPA